MENVKHILIFESIRKQNLGEYIKHESNILHYIGSRDAFIKYESDCPKENGSRVVWMNAWLPNDSHKISASISIDRNSRFFESHYQKLKAHKSKIEAIFVFEAITPIRVNSNIYQFRVEKRERRFNPNSQFGYSFSLAAWKPLKSCTGCFTCRRL